MKPLITPHVLILSALALTSPTPARADQPIAKATDGGIWLATVTPDSKAFAGCPVIFANPQVSSCDLPFSPVHSGSAIVSWPCCGGGDGKMLLPAIRDWGGPVVLDSASARLLFSDFAGRISTANSNKGFILPFISAVAVANPSARQPQWGGVPSHDFGLLGFTATVMPLPDGTLAGSFTLTLTDTNGKVVFQAGGSVVLRPVGLVL